jgi:hypothetical protein
MKPSKSDRIAICGEPIPFSLKHDLLFFDRIGVFELEQVVKLLRKRRRRDTNDLSDATASIANDLEFLESQDFVFSLPWSDWKPEQVGRNEWFEEEIKLVAKMYSEPLTGNIQLRDSLQLLSARIYARAWQEFGSGHEVSVIRSDPLPTEVEQLLGYQRPSADVIDVVLDKLPMPSEQTPWEAILDFKADTEAQRCLQGLKVWIADIARQKHTDNEARDKLEWLLDQHKKHLEVHKLSFRWGVLGATFGVAAANVLGLGSYGKIAGAVAGVVVSIVDKKIELMKAERSNPAKEVSYIVKARERFDE